MNAVPSQTVARREWSPAVSILLATIVAGTLDITYAIVASATRGVEPMVIWQSVASGLLGRASYEAGMTTAVGGADGLGRIFDDGQSVPNGEPPQRLHFGAATEQVDGEDGLRPRGDGGGDGVGIEVE